MMPLHPPRAASPLHHPVGAVAAAVRGDDGGLGDVSVRSRSNSLLRALLAKSRCRFTLRAHAAQREIRQNKIIFGLGGLLIEGVALS
jgi:hypothetical protein